MKNCAKKVLLSSFIFIMMFVFGISLFKKNVNAISTLVSMGNINVTDYHKDINGNIYNIEVSVDLSVENESDLNSLDVREYGVLFFEKRYDPSVYEGLEYSTENDGVIYDLYIMYNLLDKTHTEKFVFDYSKIRNYASGEVEVFFTFKKDGNCYIKKHLGTFSIKNIHIADGMVYTDICYNGKINVNQFISDELSADYVDGYSVLGESKIITNNSAGTLKYEYTFNFNLFDDIYVEYKYDNVLVLLDENKKIIGIVPCAEGSTALPAIPNEYKTSKDYYNKSDNNKYIQGLFCVKNSLVYYNGKFTPFSSYNISWATAVYPRYRDPQFSIVYHNDGCTNFFGTYSVDRLSCIDTITLDDIKFVKDGYSFEGWATTQGSNVVAYTNKQAVKFDDVDEGSSIDLYPVWKANNYKLTINLNDGSAKTVLNYDMDATIDTIEDPIRVGYTFDGWSEAIPSTMPSHDISIEAKWTINKHTINFYYEDGGELYKTFTFDYGTELVYGLVQKPTKTGYTFNSWSGIIPDSVPDSDLSFYAVWEINTIEIKFNTGDSFLDSQVGNYGTLVTKPENPTKLGYVFTKWEPAIPDKFPEQNLTCVAVWEKVDYIITCKLQNGEPDVYYSFGINQEITGIENPVKEHYIFMGWDINIPKLATRDLILTAMWQPIKYCIKINDADDVDYIQYYFDYNQEVVIPTPTKYNYDFVDYSEELPKYMPDNDIEVNALWVVHKYIISFDTDGGTEIEPIKIQYKSKITLPENPTKDGCEFVSWDKTLPTLMIEDIELKAIWKKNNYNLKFIVDGNVYSENIVEFDSKITIPANPTAIGYTFISWNQEIPSRMPANDLVIEAVLDKIPCSVYFLNYDKSVLSQVQYYYGDKVVEIIAPNKENYDFKGWYVDENHTRKFDFENITLTSDITIYPYYEEYQKINNVSITDNGYKVVVSSNNGIYQNINISCRVVTNEIIDQYDFTKDFRYDYSKLFFQMAGEEAAIGGVYTFKITKDGVEYEEYDMPVTIELQIPSDLTDKEVTIFGSREGVPFAITDFKIENDILKFDADTITEFVFGYSIVKEKTKEKGCNSKKIIDILGLVAMTATALFIFRKRFGQE